MEKPNPQIRKTSATRRGEIAAAAVRIAARGGRRQATVRAIADAVGVTEGAIYRHFRSMDDLWRSAFERIVEDMAHEKETLVARSLGLHETIREWVRLSYAYYDAHPEAFTYVLLKRHLTPQDPKVTRRQGDLFRQMLRNANTRGELSVENAELAVCMFSGLLLNVPRLIDSGELPGPAESYVGEITKAACRIFGLHE